ncbi:MAG: hypothetical protein DRH03_05400 [Deltaproteobacteria bacterium]|nr:MAG: hypothetical protein DRH03_05400 [Deltaproteobacteria bacterium]
MCHAFGQNGIAVTLALPESDSLLSNDEYGDYIKNIFGLEVEFAVKSYKKINLLGKFNYIGGYFGVKKLLKKIKADLCFIRNASFIDPVAASGIPFLYEAHNSVIHEGSRFSNAYWTKKIIKNSQDKRMIGFICISQALANYWAGKGIPEAKIIALHDGFSAEKFAEIKEPFAARKELGLPDNKKMVMYVGSLYPDRGIDIILKLAAAFSDVNFVVVGGPQLQQEYYRKISAVNGLLNIFFPGRVSPQKVPDYLYAADVLLMIWTDKVSTINYCSPLKTFEYMASGRTIVGHAFPTIKEVLRDGETAFLAQPGLFKELEDKLRAALQQAVSSKIGHNARREAFLKYSWAQRTKSILDFLEI